MNDTEYTEQAQAAPAPAQRKSLILRVLGIVFIGLAVWWARSFATTVENGTLGTFVGARTGAYTVTYLAAGIGMLLHARWAVFATAAWAAVAFTQSLYPPIPREEVPMMAQIALALISVLWMLGIVYFVYRKTRPPMVRDDARL